MPAASAPVRTTVVAGVTAAERGGTASETAPKDGTTGRSSAGSTARCKAYGSGTNHQGHRSGSLMTPPAPLPPELPGLEYGLHRSSRTPFT